jgi:probable F420-dependent oxidoreductase
MRVGIHVPQWGDLATRSGLVDIAQAAEAVGIDSVWVADHIVFPLESRSVYPYRADGVPFTAEDGFLEGLTSLAVLAGATERIRLGTSVLVLPLREPLTAAKTIATLDVLSGGRTVLAVGAGWWEEEFAAVGQRFSARGRRFDEQLEILRRAWSEPSFSHRGEFYSFEALSCTPLPIQKGGPPLLIGGMGAAAMRRAATLGDGWHAVGGRIDTLAEGWQTVKAAGSRTDLRLSTSSGLHPDPDRALDRLLALDRFGVDDLVLNLDAPTVPAFIEKVVHLGSDLLPRLRPSPAAGPEPITEHGEEEEL